VSRWVELAFTVAADDAESVADRLVTNGAAGVEERDASTIAKAPEGKIALVVWIEPEQVEVFLERMKGAGEVATRDRDESEWRDAWKRYFGIRRVGRFVLVPSWETFSAGADDLVLHLDPGRAFGTGGHPSTRLCLELIARVPAAGSFLDVGCGSGILSIACARKFPGAHGLGIDIDGDACEVSRENAARNGVQERIAYFTTPIDRVDGKYDLVCANIQADVLANMHEALIERVAPGGRLLLSGILVEQADETRATFGALTLDTQLDEEGWRALMLKK
jgi:ribosomal protein L11 methyltransferase